MAFPFAVVLQQTANLSQEGLLPHVDIPYGYKGQFAFPSHLHFQLQFQYCQRKINEKATEWAIAQAITSSSWNLSLITFTPKNMILPSANPVAQDRQNPNEITCELTGAKIAPRRIATQKEVQVHYIQENALRDCPRISIFHIKP